MNKIVIEVSSGIVTAIHSEEDIVVDLVDWNSIKSGEVLNESGVMLIKGIGPEALEKLRVQHRLEAAS